MSVSILNQEAKHIITCSEKYIRTNENYYAYALVVFLKNYRACNLMHDIQRTKFLISINMPTLLSSYIELIEKNYLFPSSFLKFSWEQIKISSDPILIFIFLRNFIKNSKDLFVNSQEEITFLEDLFKKPFMQNAGIFSHLFNKKILNPNILLNIDLSKINISYLSLISRLDIDFKKLNSEKQQAFSNNFISSFLTDNSNWTLDKLLIPFIENDSIVIFKNALNDKMHLFNAVNREFTKKILLNLNFNSIEKHNTSVKQLKI